MISWGRLKNTFPDSPHPISSPLSPTALPFFILALRKIYCKYYDDERKSTEISSIGCLFAELGKTTSRPSHRGALRPGVGYSSSDRKRHDRDGNQGPHIYGTSRSSAHAGGGKRTWKRMARGICGLSGQLYSKGWRAQPLGCSFPEIVHMNLNSIISWRCGVIVSGLRRMKMEYIYILLWGGQFEFRELSNHP